MSSLKRYSSIFHRKRTDADAPQGTIVNGTNGTNATANGTASEEPKITTATRRHSSFGFNRKEKDKQPDHSADRKHVDSMFRDYAQVIHASRRPMPTQTGDGTYIEHS